MANLTSQRNVAEYQTPKRLIVPVEASTKIYLGSMVGVDAAGYAVNAGNATNPALRILGRADRLYNGVPGQDADNSAGAAGAISVEIKVGAFSWAINGGDITQANMDQLCYAVDDQTVSSSSNSGARAVAGRILGLDPSTGGVFVDMARDSRSSDLIVLTAAGVAAAGPITLAGAVVGQPVKAVFGTLTAGGPLIAKVPGVDFESVISVAGQIQQLTATDLHLDTFAFVLGTK
jgi:hypothetical protein